MIKSKIWLQPSSENLHPEDVEQHLANKKQILKFGTSSETLSSSSSASSTTSSSSSSNDSALDKLLSISSELGSCKSDSQKTWTLRTPRQDSNQHFKRTDERKDEDLILDDPEYVAALEKLDLPKIPPLTTLQYDEYEERRRFIRARRKTCRELAKNVLLKRELEAYRICMNQLQQLRDQNDELEQRMLALQQEIAQQQAEVSPTGKVKPYSLDYSEVTSMSDSFHCDEGFLGSSFQNCGHGSVASSDLDWLNAGIDGSISSGIPVNDIALGAPGVPEAIEISPLFYEKTAMEFLMQELMK